MPTSHVIVWTKSDYAQGTHFRGAISEEEALSQFEANVRFHLKNYFTHWPAYQASGGTKLEAIGTVLDKFVELDYQVKYMTSADEQTNWLLVKET